jgi:cytochrome c-type biogenesis protein
MQPQLNVATAFLAGLLSFVSPCVLPLIPSYLSFLTGSTLEELKASSDVAGKSRVLAHALAFVSGFTLIFVSVGVLASSIGGALVANKELIARIGGVVVIILGLNMLGIFRLPFLMVDRRLYIRSANRSVAISFLVGIGFAAGWSPCIGPILSAILLMASQERVAEATFLLFVYSMGLAIPFLIAAAAVSSSLDVLGRVKRFFPAIEATAGTVLIATGIVLVTASFPKVAGFFYQYVKPPSL